MTSPDRIQVLDAIAPVPRLIDRREWPKIILVAVLLVALVLAFAFMIGALLDNAGATLTFRQGQSTWSPDLDRRRP